VIRRRGWCYQVGEQSAGPAMPRISPYPTDPGLPILGNTLEMARDPARFFLRMYRKHGPVFVANVFGRKTIVIAGPEATEFVSSHEGRRVLSSRAFWRDFVREFGAETIVNGEDGKTHLEIRRMLAQGYSKRALDGHFGRLLDIADRSLAAEWRPGTEIRVLPAMQAMITEQLGQLLTGDSPRAHIDDIRVMVQYMLNVLVTRQRPKFTLLSPRYRAARRRAFALADRMIADLKAQHEAGTLPDNLLGQLYRFHAEGSPYFKAQDLPAGVLGPYIAGLDTESNTVAAAIFGICKHPEVKTAVQAEADALFEKPLAEIEERDIRGLTVINACVREALRLWTIAVAQLRSAGEEFTFAGHRIAKGEMLYVATSVPHLMAEFYPDPDRFDPSRMMAPRDEHLRKSAYAPFGGGPHMCLGQGIAETQMAMNLARIFHRLDLDLLHPDYVMPTKTAPTPGPTNGFRVRVLRHRQSKA
jgi:cytochrome P450